MMRKLGFVIIVLFVLLLSSSIILAAPLEEITPPEKITPPGDILLECPNDCSPQSNCWCGGVKIEADTQKYCGPDDVVYLSESECEFGTPVAPPPPEPPPPWQGFAVLAIVTSGVLLGIIYMVGYGFGVSELMFVAKEEMYQIIVLIVLVALLAASDGVFNWITQSAELRGTSNTMQEAALTSIQDTLSNVTDKMNNIKGMDNGIAIEASKGLQCSILGVGYSVTGCGGFSMLSTPFSLVGSILGFAAGELYSVQRLIEISTTYSMTLLLPLGIILRTFKITRGAGGLLMAVAVSTYLLLPMGIIFIDKFGDAFKSNMLASTVSPDDQYYFNEPATMSFSPPTGTEAVPGLQEWWGCNPGDTTGAGLFYIETAGRGSNEDKAINAYLDLRKSIRSYLFLVVVKATLGPVVAILMLIAGIRALTALGGAEIDVSALGRLV